MAKTSGPQLGPKHGRGLATQLSPLLSSLRTLSPPAACWLPDAPRRPTRQTPRAVTQNPQRFLLPRPLAISCASHSSHRSLPPPAVAPRSATSRLDAFGQLEGLDATCGVDKQRWRDRTGIRKILLECWGKDRKRSHQRTAHHSCATPRVVKRQRTALVERAATTAELSSTAHQRCAIPRVVIRKERDMAKLLA